jgi:hypothetical protein
VISGCPNRTVIVFKDGDSPGNKMAYFEEGRVNAISLCRRFYCWEGLLLLEVKHLVKFGNLRYVYQNIYLASFLSLDILTFNWNLNFCQVSFFLELVIFHEDLKKLYYGANETIIAGVGFAALRLIIAPEVHFMVLKAILRLLLLSTQLEEDGYGKSFKGGKKAKGH